MARITVESEMTENELLEALMAEIADEIDLSCEVCVPMFEEKGLTRDVASHMIEKKVRAGELVSRDARYKGHRVIAYRKP